MKFCLKWVHMARYELILRLDGALWLRIILKPLLTPKGDISDPKILKQNVENTDDKELIRALIVRGFGVGNIPLQGDFSLFPLVEYLRKRQIPVIMTSQCFRGHTELALYPSGRKLLDHGVIEARDMTFESVITKTMWALAHPEMNLQEWFNIDLAGEMTSH